jgi:hypothetical protein
MRQRDRGHRAIAIHDHLIVGKDGHASLALKLIELELAEQRLPSFHPFAR